MIINPKDYTDYTEFQAAVLKALDEDGQIYVNKAEYDLDRSCEQEDYFINLLLYVDVTNENTVDIDLDDNPFPGFEDYDAPPGAFPVYYLAGQFTETVDGPTYYNPGVPITFGVIGTNDNVPIGGLEVLVTMTFLSMSLDPVTVTFTWVEGYSVNIPMLETYIGGVTITTSLPSAAAQPIFLEFAGGPMSSEGFTAATEFAEVNGSSFPIELYTAARVGEDAPEWFSNVVNFVVPEMTGTEIDTDQQAYLDSNYYSADYRLLPSKHLTVTMTSNTYNPALLGGVLTFTFAKKAPALDTYSYDVIDGDQYNPITVIADQKSSYESFEAKLSIYDGDGTPVQVNDVEFPDDDTITIFQNSVTLDDEYVGPLFAVVTLEHAYNYHFVPEDGNTVPGLTFSVIYDRFEPGGFVTVQMLRTQVADGEYNSAPVYSTLALSAALYETAETIGSAIVSESFVLNEPGFAGSSGQSLLELSLDMPLTYDRDAYWKFTVLPVTPIYSNSLDYAYPGTDVIQLSDIATVQYEVNGTPISYWDIDQPDVPIQFVITPNEGISLSDYSATVLLTTGVASPSFTTLSAQPDVLLSSYTITPSDYPGIEDGINFLLQISIAAL